MPCHQDRQLIWCKLTTFDLWYLLVRFPKPTLRSDFQVSWRIWLGIFTHQSQINEFPWTSLEMKMVARPGRRTYVWEWRWMAVNWCRCQRELSVLVVEWRYERELSAATSPTSHFTSTGTDQHYYQMPLSSCDNYLLSAYIYTKYSRAICNFYSLPLLWPPEPHPLSIQGWPEMAFCIPDFLILLIFCKLQWHF